MNKLIRPRIAYSATSEEGDKVYTFLEPEESAMREIGALLVVTEQPYAEPAPSLMVRTLQSMIMRSEIDDKQAHALAQANWAAPEGFVVLTRSRQEIISFKEALGKENVDKEMRDFRGEDYQDYSTLWVWICKPSGAEWDISGSSGYHTLEHTLDRCPGWRVYPAHEVAKMFTPAKQEG